MISLDSILSNDLIVNQNYVNKKLYKMATDTNGSILYDMNEHGYRSISTKLKSDYNILTLGCSWTMGVGVQNEDIWPNVISKNLGTTFNYGMYGVSTSFIAKTFYKFVVSQFSPNVCLIMWPGFSRRDYINSEGEFRKIGGFRLANNEDVVWKNKDEDVLFLELRNDYQDLMIFWEAYNFVETIAKLYDIKLYHTIAGYYYDVFSNLENHLVKTIDYNRFFIPKNCYKNDLKGADNQHPGKDWHINFGNEFYKFIKDKL
jgi:hypothetical protein